jgi:PhnB protein
MSPSSSRLQRLLQRLLQPQPQLQLQLQLLLIPDAPLAMQASDYPALTPYLTVHDGLAAIAFYTTAFGAVERYRLTSPDGKLGHCEMTLGGQVFMLAEEWPPHNKSARTLGGVATRFVLQVPDADAAHARALAAGATTIMPPTDMFYGFRNACIRDPFDHEWMLQHCIADVSPAEMQQRFDAMCSDGSASGA